MDETKTIGEKKAKRNLRSSISGKLILTLLPIIAVTIIFIIAFMTLSARNIIVDQASGQLLKESSSNAYQLGNEVNSLIRYFDAFADSLERLSFSGDKELLAYVERTTEIDPNTSNGFYFGTTAGDYWDASGWVPDADYVPSERPWYTEGLSHNTFAPGAPYVDEQSGDLVVTLSRKLTLKDGRSGVVAVDYVISGIVESVSSFTPLKTGGCMLLDGDDILSYFKSDFVGSTVSEHPDDLFLTQAAAIAKTNPADVQIIKSHNGITYYVAFANVPGTSWTLISSVAEGDILGRLYSFQTVAMILMVIVIVLIALLLYRLISRMVTKPVGSLTRNITRITDGDFTVKIDDNHSEDEVGVMNRNMKVFVDKMRDTLGNLQHVTEQLGEEARNSSSASKTLYNEAEEQSNSMDQIKLSIDGMAQAVSELAQNATELATAVAELTGQGNETNQVMEALAEKSRNGQEDMNNVRKGMKTIVASMSDMNDSVNRVGESAQKINDIISMINSIASQTNLLSLNASIEAARAGEAGKGFAVVAGEIGALASNSADATSQIEAIIREVVAEIDELSRKSAANMEEISESSKSVKLAGQTFEEIVNELSETEKTMASMIHKMNDVDNIATSVAAISEEQSASTEEISATVENLAESATNVAAMSRDVSGSAETVSSSSATIQEFVESFTIE